MTDIGRIDALSAALAIIPNAAYSCDDNGKITFFNDAAVRVWGRAPALLSNNDLYCGSYRLYDTAGKRVPHDSCWMALALREKQPMIGREIVVERPDGSRRLVKAHAAPIEQGGINILVDITPSEEDLRDVQLRKLGLLAGAIAHDYNNALTGIIGTLDLLLFDLTAQPIKDRVRTALDCARDASSRVRQLYRLQQQSEQPSNATVLDMTDLLSGALAQASSLMAPIERESKRIILKREYEKDTLVRGDESQLRAVFYNLLKNALEAMPTGGILGCESKKEGSKVVARISDTGTGIAKDILPKVFRPFFSTKGCVEGRGLGLAGSLETIKAHGGDLYIASTAQGTGTTMELWLPHAYSNKP